VSWDEEEEDYFFMTPPRAAGMSTSHSSVSSEVGSTASPFVGALDPAVLCRVLHQLGYVNAIGVLDSPCDIYDGDHLATSFSDQLGSPRANIAKYLKKARRQ
jgi:hypothetical protein